MSIQDLSEKGKETLKRIAALNGIKPEEVLRIMSSSASTQMVTCHHLDLKLV